VQEAVRKRIDAGNRMADRCIHAHACSRFAVVAMR
jgi:hypothetical protein